MLIPLKSWHRLGRKTFWIFLLRHSKLFLVILALAVWFTRNVVWGNWQDWYQNFFINNPELYLTPQLVIMTLWLAIVGYLLVIFLYSWVIYRQYKFMLDEHALYVRRGIFFIREAVIPYRQIQNVEINRPWLYRIIGLAELDLTTLSVPEFNVHHASKKPEKKKNLLPVIDYRIAKILARNLVERGSSNTLPPEVEEDGHPLGGM